MKRRSSYLRTCLGFAVLLLVVAGGTTTPPALAQGPSNAPVLQQAAATSYTLTTSFSADPENSAYTPVFTADVRSIFAWAMLVSSGPEKELPVDVQFISPTGQKVASQWYEGDKGSITSGPTATLVSAGGTPAKNVARRQIDVAFTPNEKLTGQWTVVFSVQGKPAVIENFVLTSADELAISDAQDAAKAELEELGYAVSSLVIKELTGKKSVILYMPMVSIDLYSSETSQQLMDAFAVTRKALPLKAGSLLVFLEYDPRYSILYLTTCDEWDAYVKDKNFAAFTRDLYTEVYDKEAGAYIRPGSKDFINKTFGVGSLGLPLGVPGPKQASVGSIRVQPSALVVPADNSSTIQVNITVFDKHSKPVANMPISFRLSGTVVGTIDTKAARTTGTGLATVTFRAGRKDGAMALTATSGTTNATLLLTVGQGNKDGAMDAARAYLSSQGYPVTDVLYDKGKSTARVVLDPGSMFDIQQVPAEILDGTIALREYFPDATALEVAVRYRTSYMLLFPATATDVDQAIAAANEAGADYAKLRVSLQSFLNAVFDKAVAADLRTGQSLGTFKDIMNKSFGGG